MNRGNQIFFVYVNKFKDYPILYEYCSILHARGNAIHYFGISDRAEEYTDVTGVRVTHLNRAEVKSPVQFARAIARFVKKDKPDAVHVFQFRWCFLLPLFSMFSTRFILDVRSVHVVGKSGKHSVLTPLKNRLTWIESLFYTKTFALTSGIKRILTPSFSKIPVIPLGANLEKLRPVDVNTRRQKIRQQLKLKSTTIVFIYSGTINPIRRIDLLIEAFKTLSHRIDDIHMVIAGEDKDNSNMVDILKTQTGKLGIGTKVSFTGHLAYDTLINFYHASDIGLCYVPQVRYFDLQPPTKLYEYIAAGLLTISTSTSAAREIIKEGVNGFLARDTPQEFADKMFEVVDNHWEDRLKIVATAYQTIEKYNWEYIIDNYVQEEYKLLRLTEKRQKLQ
jgi:glycosyltransferase involved in cell wall biosynthesis